MLYEIQRLAKSHDRKSFFCGIGVLDDYLKQYALQNDKMGIASTYAALDGKRVVGYYTLSNASITLSDVPETLAKKLPSYPVPVIRIGRFAVDQSLQGTRLDRQLLADTFRKCIESSKISAAYAIIVDAKAESVDFYTRYGFIASPNSSALLFIPIKTVVFALG